jgi:hypothetical protein
MKTLTITLATLATITLMSITCGSARAEGFGWYVASRPVYQTSIYAASPQLYYTSGIGVRTVIIDGHHADVWHDTSHLHYRPARVVRHGNHLHYVPGRYLVHRTGHWDHVHP